MGNIGLPKSQMDLIFCQVILMVCFLQFQQINKLLWRNIFANTWTALSQATINCGYIFQKKVTDVSSGEITWESVHYNDNAVQCSGLQQAFWSDVDIIHKWHVLFELLLSLFHL